MEDRSPQLRIGQLASRTGVSPERLRAWETRYRLLEPGRSAGNFRLYSREDEFRVRLMQRHMARGLGAAEAAELARNGIVSPSPARVRREIPAVVTERSFELLRAALHDFDDAAANLALDDLFRAYTIEAVLRDAVVPFLREVGEAWASGEVTPGQEHFASSILHGRLSALARGWGSGTGERVLLACPPGERHVLGLMAFGITLARRGRRITFLGEDVPVAALAHASRCILPELVVLAAAQERWFAQAADSLETLARSHPLALAGAGATAPLATRIGAQLLTADPVSAAVQHDAGAPRQTVERRSSAGQSRNATAPAAK